MEKNSKIVAEISAGELLDKISILEIKLEKIKNKDNQIQITKEYDILKKAFDMNINVTDELKILIKEIKEVNLTLWDIEDKLRIYENDKNFNEDFIKLARGVYLNNDKRAKIKSKINSILGSNIREIKQYVDYK